MEKFDSIIFDIDGTIWDSTDVVADAYNLAFERAGVAKKVTGDELKGLFGKTMDVIFDQLFPEMETGFKRKLQEECIKEEDELLKTRSGNFFGGIIDTMKTLSRDYPLYIVSNAQCGYIEEVMGHGGFAKYIKGHLCFGDTGVSKGETIKILMEHEGLQNPVYVGDIQGDADACKVAGIPIIHAAYGFGTIEAPAARIEKPGDLLEIL